MTASTVDNEHINSMPASDTLIPAFSNYMIFDGYL